MNEILYLLAFAVLLFVAAVDCPLLYLVYKSGKGAKSHTEIPVNNHVRAGNRFLLMMVVTVLLIKTMTTLKYGLFGEFHLMDTSLGKFHLGADVAFSLIAAAMKLYYKGTTWPRFHVFLAWLLILSYVIIVVTGAYLVFNLVSSPV